MSLVISYPNEELPNSFSYELFLTAEILESLKELLYRLQDQVSKPGTGKELFSPPIMPRTAPISTKPATENLKGALLPAMNRFHIILKSVNEWICTSATSLRLF